MRLKVKINEAFRSEGTLSMDPDDPGALAIDIASSSMARLLAIYRAGVGEDAYRRMLALAEREAARLATIDATLGPGERRDA